MACTMVYNALEAVVALWAGFSAGSIALVGFGLDSVIELAAASVVDLIAEPYRRHLLPGFDEAKQELHGLGALAVGISGSGPTIFALADTGRVAKASSARPSWVSTASQAAIAAFKSPVWPTMSGLAKLTTMRS